MAINAAHNFAVERTVGSHTLATAAHRGRYAESVDIKWLISTK